jgi:quercetin dioxygenase-like cupin family protein
VEIRRFGVGSRRNVGPPGTEGVEGVVIHSDARAVISELAFRRNASIPVHDNPNTTWFIVIEGGGAVRVGDEEQPVSAGEAVLWPADTLHGARTQHTTMRALVVELAGADDSHARDVLEGRAKRLGAGERGQVARGEGHLAPRDPDPADLAREGEPA